MLALVCFLNPLNGSDSNKEVIFDYIKQTHSPIGHLHLFVLVTLVRTKGLIAPSVS